MTPPGVLIRPSLMAFAKELRAARLYAEMSQDELAKRAKMTRQGLDKIERGGNCTLGSIIHAVGSSSSCSFCRFVVLPDSAGP